ncbi:MULTISPECIES: very short patch repair endonuclease [Collimonas]|uniref:very short patch repair endonuclease n=1 Tax=Collimonas TaxID=202907 RepID=UPI001969A6B7|nr:MULTISPECIES: very short patch repair endonuclease [Collimonas]HWW05602.1 very short patch repair endonuclease [Collimonas sp.]
MDRISVAERSRTMAQVRSKDTKPEMIVRSTLHRLGYRYVLHSRKLVGTPDLVFPARHKVIFVHGCFWHDHSCKYGQSRPKSNVEYWERKISGNASRDKRNIAILRRTGWRVMIIWECDIRKSIWLKKALRFLNDREIHKKFYVS